VKDEIIECLLEAGFDLAGVAEAKPLHNDFSRFKHWIKSGCAAGMAYLERNLALRLDPAAILPGARFVIVAAAAYPPISPPGPLAAYAVCRDYHTLFRRSLEIVAGQIGRRAGSARFAVAVDTAPLLERAFAVRAGIGWVGRSTNLITERFGPYVLLGEILTDLELEPDSPASNRCEECDLCLDACPTGALSAPFELDSRRCVSYLTIEKKGLFSPGEEKPLKDRVFGCDLCLAACPHAAALISGEARPAGKLLSPVPSLVGADTGTIRDLCEKGFKLTFGETPVSRAGKKGLLRNLDAAQQRAQ